MYVRVGMLDTVLKVRHAIMHCVCVIFFPLSIYCSSNCLQAVIIF